MIDPGMTQTLRDLALAGGATWADVTAKELFDEDGLDYADAFGLQRAEISDTIFGVRFTQNVAGALIHHVELYVTVGEESGAIIRQYRVRGDEILT